MQEKILYRSFHKSIVTAVVMITGFGNLETTVVGAAIHLEMMRKITEVLSQDGQSLD